jgi:hypothetical protein
VLSTLSSDAAHASAGSLPIEAQLPNALRAAKPGPQPLVWRPWLMLGLVLLWLVPRAVVATRLDVLCADGGYYIHIAEHLEHVAERGQLTPDKFNLYPTTLVQLHHLGLDYETASKWWGVVCGTLIVLPLFGWVRRQFDDRTATIACMLLAFHPKLVEWTPEMVRDPTFLLCMTSMLYFTWRAVREVRWSMFVAGGVMTALAMQLRFEGWFLFIPLGMWSCWRFWSLAEGRLRLAVGVAMFVLAYPLVMLGVNLAWGSGYTAPIVGGNLHRLGYVQYWLSPPPATIETKVVATSTALEGAALVAPAELRQPMTNGWASRLIARTVYRGFSLAHALLAIAGVIVWRRLLLRSDNQPLLYFFAIVVLGMWLHTWEARGSSSRYALSLVLVSSPFMAAGLLALAKQAEQLRRRLMSMSHVANLLPTGAVTSGLVLVAAIGFTEILLDGDTGSRPKQSLGNWIRQALGPGQHILGSPRYRLAGYYADSEYEHFDFQELRQFVHDSPPDVFVLDRKCIEVHDLERTIAGLNDMKYQTIDSARLPADCREQVIVLVHPNVVSQASKSRAASRR